MSAALKMAALAGAAAAVVTGATLLGGGSNAAEEVDWDERPAAVECVGNSVLATDGGYAWAEECFDKATPEDKRASALVGVERLAVTRKVVASRGKKLRLLSAGEASGFPCACSSGAACESNLSGAWVSAPKTGNTLPEGAWRGTGCIPKSCVELAGRSSMPEECR